MAVPTVVRLLVTLIILGAVGLGVALYVPPVNGYTNQWLGERAGQRLIEQQQWAEAEATLSPLTDEFPDNATIGRLYAESLSHPGKKNKAANAPPEKAMATWQRLREAFPKDAGIAAGYARLLSKYSATRQQAVNVYRGAITQFNPSASLLNDLAHTFLAAVL
jgi:predicted Zn-dependent protease